MTLDTQVNLAERDSFFLQSERMVGRARTWERHVL